VVGIWLHHQRRDYLHNICDIPDFGERKRSDGAMNNSEDQKYQHYLLDLGYLIRERALDAKERQSRKEKGSLDYLFEAGRLLAFNEVISLMQQQATGFDIDLKELNLHDIDPDKDLI
jgi:hypothetical protein